MRLEFICASAILLAGTAQAQRYGAVVLTPPANTAMPSPSTSGSFLGGGACSTATVTLGNFQTFTLGAGGPQTNPVEAICRQAHAITVLGFQTAIGNEEWWLWTDPSTVGQPGVATLEVCGLSTVDTKVAIYENDCANILLLDPLACKDNSDSCGFGTTQTRVTWDSVGGESYLIQLGTAPATAGGMGQFDITIQPARPAGQYDLGASFNANGIGAPPMGGPFATFDSMIGHTFDAGQGELINSVGFAWGTPIAAGFPLPAVLPAQLVIYSGEPGSLVHLADQPIVYSLENTDTFVTYTLTSPVAVTGLYSVAVVVVLDNTNGAFFPFGSDDSVNSIDGATGLARAWDAIEQAAAPFDIMNPDGAQLPAQDVQLGGQDRVFMLRVDTVPNVPTFANLCNGDGGNQMGCTPCPCGNNTAPGTIGGCTNSSGNGTRISASGDASASTPPGVTTDLRLELSGAPSGAFCVMLSGSAVAPQNSMNACFGLDSGAQANDRDGLRCAVMNLKRHGGRSANASGTIMASSGPDRVWGGEAQPNGGLWKQGGFMAGQTRFFQVTHREDMALVCGLGLNTSQAVEVLFLP